MSRPLVLLVLGVLLVTALVVMHERNCHFNTHLVGRIYCADDD